MLILAFGFRDATRPRPPIATLSSKISPGRRGTPWLFPIYLHRWTLRFGTTSLERCLVPSPCDGIKPVIYCSSIRQRERNCFRQLNFWPLGLWSQQTTLRMLTYHFGPLSNPVNPEMLHHTEIQCFAYKETPSCGQCVDTNPWLSSPFQAISYCKISTNAWNHKIKRQYFACVWTKCGHTEVNTHERTDYFAVLITERLHLRPRVESITDDNVESNWSIIRKYSSKRSEFLRFNLYFCQAYRRILLFVFATLR